MQTARPYIFATEKIILTLPQIYVTQLISSLLATLHKILTNIQVAAVKFSQQG